MYKIVNTKQRRLVTKLVLLGYSFLFSPPATQEEQHRLKQELASLAITLNMEAQKRRVQVEDGGRERMRATAKEIMVGWEKGGRV